MMSFIEVNLKIAQPIDDMYRYDGFTYDNWMEHILLWQPRNPFKKQFKPVLKASSLLLFTKQDEIRVPKQFQTPELVLLVKLL